MRSTTFICYSHRDRQVLDELKKHLKPHLRGSAIVPWDDTHIRSGDDWRKSILQELESARIAIVLVSPDFLESDFIHNEELPRILDASDSQGLRILWIAVRSSAFETIGIGKYQCVNDPRLPLGKFEGHARDEEWVRMAKIIAAELHAISTGDAAEVGSAATRMRRAHEGYGLLSGSRQGLPASCALIVSPNVVLTSDLALNGYCTGLHFRPGLQMVFDVRNETQRNAPDGFAVVRVIGSYRNFVALEIFGQREQPAPVVCSARTMSPGSAVRVMGYTSGVGGDSILGSLIGMIAEYVSPVRKGHEDGSIESSDDDRLIHNCMNGTLYEGGPFVDMETGFVVGLQRHGDAIPVSMLAGSALAKSAGIRFA